MINWKISKHDAEEIHHIAKRVIEALDYPDDILTLEMDLTACHLNGNPLDLASFADAVHDLPTRNGYSTDVIHDIYGIRRHINRETGKLENFFVPRFSLPE